MADLNVKIVESSGTANYALPAARWASRHCGYLYDFHGRIIYVCIGFQDASANPANHLYLYKSSDYGETWIRESIESNVLDDRIYRVAGSKIWQDLDGYIYVVTGYGQNHSPYSLKPRIIHNRVPGVWTTVELDLNSASVNGDAFAHSMSSYIWPHGDGTWDIWVAGLARISPGDNELRVIRWNTSTGVTAAESLNRTVGTLWESEAIQDLGSIVPNPTIGPDYGAPILAADATGTAGLKIVTAKRSVEDGGWVSLGQLIGDLQSPSAAYGRLHVRKTANTAGHLVELWYYMPNKSGYVIASHDLDDQNSWDDPQIRRTASFLQSYYGIIQFAELYPGTPYMDTVVPYYNRSGFVYRQIPPHSDPVNQYAVDVSLAAGTFVNVLGGMYLPGPDGQKFFPQQQFLSGYAFPYEADQSGQRSIWFFKKDGTQFYDPDAITPFLESDAQHTILLGVTPKIDGQALAEASEPIIFPTQNNLSGAYVYQKVEFYNDLADAQHLDLIFTSDVGTPHVAMGTAIDTKVDAIGYTYTSNTATVASIAAAGSAYVWLRWTPPTNFRTEYVGRVKHTLYREIYVV